MNWDISRKDAGTIAQIIERAWSAMQKCYKDRIEGELKDCFVPRYSKPEGA